MIGPLTNFEKVQEFHTAMEARRNVWPPSEDLIRLRWDLITEEIRELGSELYPESEKTYPEASSTTGQNKEQIAKEIADALYVLYGTADSFGIDIDRVFTEVHRSNMSKLVDGKPLKREDGKVLKGPNYTPPNLSFIGE